MKKIADLKILHTLMSIDQIRTAMARLSYDIQAEEHRRGDQS